jgi:hypothetical protein
MAIEDLFASPDYLRQLLGEEQFDRAKQSALNQGIINASLQLLAGSPPSYDNRGATGRLLAQAGQAGLQGYQTGMDKVLTDMLRGSQVKEMIDRQNLRKAQQSALRAATTGIQPEVVPQGQTLRDDQGELTMGATPEKQVMTPFNTDVYKAYALRLGVDPKDISATIESMRPKTQTVKPGDIVLGEDNKPVFQAPKEANLQAVDTPQGLMLFNPVTGAVTPARGADGQPIMGDKSKPPTKFTEQITYINNLKTSVADYVNDIKNTDPRYVFPGSAKAAELQTKYSDLMMQLKDAYGLGALQAPDLVVMNKIITDPVSMAGRYKGKESLQKQLDTINDVFASRELNLYKTYQQSIPKGLKEVKTVAPEDVGLTLPQGVTVKRVK